MGCKNNVFQRENGKEKSMRIQTNDRSGGVAPCRRDTELHAHTVHLLLDKERPSEKLGWTMSSQTIANHSPKQHGVLSFALFLMGEGYIFRKKYETKENGVIL